MRQTERTTERTLAERNTIGAAAVAKKKSDLISGHRCERLTRDGV